jgi:hypothetical protein
MTFQDWLILIGLVLPIVGNIVAFGLRKAGKPALAATVDQIIPLSARLGMAKDAKDLIAVAHEAAHVITTTEPNSIKLTNEDESVSVRMDLAPAPKDPPSAAPPGSVVLGGILFALLAFGCSAAQQVAQISAEIIQRAEPCLVAQYELAQEQCLELHTVEEQRGCVADVRLMWKPVIDGLVELRTVRCEIEPAKCGADR